jgi:hypothetical protein
METQPDNQGVQPMQVVAVVAGWATDIVSTQVFGVALGLLLGLIAALNSDVLDIEALAESTGFLLFLLPCGLAFTVLGGGIAGVVARRDPVWHALAAGILSLLTSILMLLGGHEQPFWFTVTGIVLTLPAALLGGFFAGLINRKFNRA